MRTRAQGLLAYTIILATCTAGILNLSWWAFAAGACALALVSISNYSLTYRTLGGDHGTGSVLFLSSMLNAAATSAAALMVGRVIGWTWGV